MNGLDFPGELAGGDHSRTVPRELTHRAAIAEVFLTRVADLGGGDYELAAQLPRFHAFYGDTGPGTGPAVRPARHDPLLVLELCRQASLLLAHRCHGIPVGPRFVLREADATVLDPAGLAIGDAPAQAALRCRTERRFERDGQLIGFNLRYTVGIGGRATMAVALSISWMPEEAWRELRARRDRGGPPALAPAGRAPASAVGRLNPFNVVIGPLARTGKDTTRAGLVADTSHPVLFDHPLDHVPGMLTLEAFRQTALASAAGAVGMRPEQGELSRIRARFLSMVELDMAATCCCVTGAGGDVTPAGTKIDTECRLLQGERTAAEGTVRLAFPATQTSAPAATGAGRLLPVGR